MGAKFVSLATPTATVNTLGVPCKVDADCTNGKGKRGVDKTAVTAITDATKIKESCCMYLERTVLPNGTTAETKVGTDLNITYYNYYGLTKNLGEANLYCDSSYPTTIKNYKDTTKTASYDAATGLVVTLKANGAQQLKSYCDGGAQTLAVATMAVAAAAISMY
jgi:hypothetical protein